MPRLIFQRTAHLPRYRCAPTMRKTAHHDTLVSHQGLLDPLSSASLPHCLLRAALWQLFSPRTRL